MKISFPGYSGPTRNWDEYVHADPYQNVSAVAALALFRGLASLKLLEPAMIYVRGQNIKAMELTRALAEGLPEDKPVNIVCVLSLDASSKPHTVAQWVKWIASDFAGGLRQVCDSVRDDLGLPAFDDWLLRGHGNLIFTALAEEFQAGVNAGR